MNDKLRELSFWGIYLLIPMFISFVVILIEGIMVFFVDKKEDMYSKKLEFYPDITIIIAVENCKDNLKRCLESILEQDYPLNKIQVLLMDNNSTDRSKDVFYEMQIQYPKFRIWWIDGDKGKVNSINKGIYISEGKYIINIDCNGRMAKNLLKNFVYRFENDPKVCALSSHVVTEHELIEKIPNRLLKVFRKYELISLLRSSAVKESFKARFDSMFILSRECSAFRRDTLLKTQLYNSKIANENIHMGSQIIKFLNGKIDIAEGCFFYKRPLESISDFYLEKQKTRLGKLEIFKLFKDNSLSKFNIFLNIFIISDHTVMLMQIMFFFSTIYLALNQNSLVIILEMWGVIYLFDILISIMCLVIIKKKMENEKDILLYIMKNLGLLIIIPICNCIGNIQGVSNFFKDKEELEENNIIGEFKRFKRKLRNIFNGVKGECAYEEGV